MIKQSLTRLLLLVVLLISGSTSFAQKKDSVHVTSEYSGSLGFSTNGLSIIPTFALNAPAVNVLLSVKRNRFSFDPDIRLTLDGKRGGMVFWFRYQAVKGKRFNLQTGAHPAYNLQLRKVTEGNSTTEITQARRFFATEIFPTYQLTKKTTLGVYYLKGFGLQKDGPMDSHFLTFNVNFSSIPIFKDHILQFTPQVFYLKIDKEDGFYYTHTIGIASTKHPFSLQSTINKEIKTNITGSQNLAWNLSVFYSFNRKYGRGQNQEVFRIAEQITEF